uniref:Uncharacterized protein n=1 Tax=Vitis vinifera TaxID=29760 RepID=F6HTV9_VITVI
MLYKPWAMQTILEKKASTTPRKKERKVMVLLRR